MNLRYIIGDATRPVKMPALITHVCNDLGGWGRGFVLALSKSFPEVEAAYRKWFSYPVKPQLGDTQIVETKVEGIAVANMVAQHDVRWHGKIPPIRYGALERCLRTVYKDSHQDFTVHMPRIGSVLAGGDWNVIEGIIKKVMVCDTYVYTLPEQKDRWNDKYEEA